MHQPSPTPGYPPYDAGEDSGFDAPIRQVQDDGDDDQDTLEREILPSVLNLPTDSEDNASSGPNLVPHVVCFSQVSDGRIPLHQKISVFPEVSLSSGQSAIRESLFLDR